MQVTEFTIFSTFSGPFSQLANLSCFLNKVSSYTVGLRKYIILPKKDIRIMKCSVHFYSGPLVWPPGESDTSERCNDAVIERDPPQPYSSRGLFKVSICYSRVS